MRYVLQLWWIELARWLTPSEVSLQERVVSLEQEVADLQAENTRLRGWVW
jgi:hypothetical protein